MVCRSGCYRRPRPDDRETGSDSSLAKHRARQLPSVGDGKPPRLELRPAFHFRHHEAPVDEGYRRALRTSTPVDGRYEIARSPACFRPCACDCAVCVRRSRSAAKFTRSFIGRNKSAVMPHEGISGARDFSRSIWRGTTRHVGRLRPRRGTSSTC